MREFKDNFFRKIYLVPWVLFIMWAILLLFRLFDIILWVQGHTEFIIIRVLFILLVISVVITRTIVKKDYAEKSSLYILPFVATVVLLIYVTFLFKSPITYEFYTESGSTIIITEENGLTTFYKQELIFAKRIDHCYSERCEYHITNNTLVIEKFNTFRDNDIDEIPLD